MTDDADLRLKALFAGDEPPARDPIFAAAVMARVERRRFILDVAYLTGATALGGLVLWALWPALSPLLVDAGPTLAPAAAALTLAAVTLFLLEGRVTAAGR